MGVRIALDFFPAKVTLPSGAELDPAKVYIADDRVLVYILQNGEPVLYFERDVLSTAGTTIRGMQIQVADGIVKAVKARGCGCGNPLKNYNPWPGQRRELVRS